MEKVRNHQAALLSTAVRLFQEQGYHGTGLTQLLKESGAPKGSLYHHFPEGKEQIAAEAVAQAAHGIELMAASVIAKAESGPAAVTDFAKRLANWFKGTGYRAGCPVTAVLLDTVPSSPLTTQACSQAFTSWIDVWANCFENHGLEAHRALELAQLWVAGLEGAWIMARSQQSTAPFIAVGRMFARQLKLPRINDQ